MDRLTNSYIEDEPDSTEPFPKFHKLSLIRAVWKRRVLCLSVWLAVSALTAVIVRLLPSVYRAEALVMVDSQKIPENFVSATVGGELSDRLAAINEHIMSSGRLLDAIHALHLYEEKGNTSNDEERLREIRRDISVNFEKSWTGGRMQSFRLRYECSDPHLAAQVANRLAALYVAENARTREDQAAGTVTFLASQLKEAKASLDEQEAKVAQFKQQHSGTLPEQETSLLATLNNLSVQLQGVQGSIDRAQENRLSLQAALSAGESSEASLRAATTSRSFADSSRGSALRSEILEEKLQGLRAQYTSDHPAIQKLERELAEVKVQEAAQLTAALSGAKTQAAAEQERQRSIMSPTLIQSQERITMLRAQLEVAGSQMGSLERQRAQIVSAIADCQSKIQRLPLVEQEMAALKRNYEQSANAYNSLLQKKLAAGIATDMERSQKSEQFTVVDPAHVPQSPVKPQRLPLVLAGFAAGLFLGVAVSLALEIRKQTFAGEWQLPPGVPILGRVPVMPGASTSSSPSGWTS